MFILTYREAACGRVSSSRWAERDLEPGALAAGRSGQSIAGASATGRLLGEPRQETNENKDHDRIKSRLTLIGWS